jgi:chemotaxis response regulator CheB
MEALNKKTRILVVDDHPVATRGSCTVIDSEADMEVCGTAATTADAMRLFNRLNPSSPSSTFDWASRAGSTWCAIY